MKHLSRAFSRTRLAVLTAWVLCGLLALTYPAAPAHAITYGSGEYGRCQYGSCNITLTSSTTVAIDVIPSPGSTDCTVASDTVTVTTSSSNGYSLQLNDTSAASDLTLSGGGSIGPVSGSAASPAALSANSWGYRVDGTAGFGTGPTSAVSNGSIPVLPFAAVPNSGATPDTITQSSTAASSGAATSVWYGVCVDTTIASGSYTNGVVYTATIN